MDGPITIRLTGRRPVGNAVVGVLRAAMDEELGVPLAELHVARRGHASERLRVRTGQRILLDGATYAVAGIWPWNGRSPAGVVLRRVVGGAEFGDELG